MKELNIRAIWINPYTKINLDPDFDRDLKNILNRNFNLKSANRVWLTDITYIHTLSGFVYLASVMGLYSRKIIGWHLSDNLSTLSVLKAIEKAKSNIKLENPVIIHSDRGVQYSSKSYIEIAIKNSLIRSYSRKGNPWDNAVIESFHALIKREWINRFVIKHLSQAHELICEYIEIFYNTQRIHSHCMMESPYDYEKENSI